MLRDGGVAVSVSELDGWGRPLRRRPRLRRSVRLGAGALSAGLLGWYVVWIFVGIHGNGPVAWEDTGHVTACAPDPLVVPGDVTIALAVGSLGPYHAMEIRLVDPQNVSLVEADIGKVALGANPPALPPAAAGWPALPGGAIAADSLVPAVGATIRSGTDALVLHLHVADPRVEAGFRDVGIVYRAGALALRYEQRLAYGQRLVVGSACT